MARNFFDGLLQGQQFVSNLQAQQSGAIDLGFKNLEVGNEFQFLGEFQNGGFQNQLNSNNPYVAQRGFSNLASNQAAVNSLQAQQANMQLAQQIAAQLGVGQQQQQVNPALGGLLPGAGLDIGGFGLSGLGLQQQQQPRNVVPTPDTRFSGVDPVSSLKPGPFTYLQ